MGHWVNISGYMVVNNAIPTRFSRMHNNEDMWTTEPHCMDTVAWIHSLLSGARENSGSLWPYAGLPTHVTYRHFNCETGEELDEVIWVPKEDEEKLKFPAGNEGPANLTIVANMSADGLRWHVVVEGSLGDDCYSVKPFKEWWETVTKYLDVTYGHFWCKGLDGEYENSYFFDNDEGRNGIVKPG